MGEEYINTVYCICFTDSWTKGKPYSIADFYNRRGFFLDDLTNETDIKKRWEHGFENKMDILCSLLETKLDMKYRINDFSDVNTLGEYVNMVISRIKKEGKVSRPPEFGNRDPAIEIYQQL